MQTIALALGLIAAALGCVFPALAFERALAQRPQPFGLTLVAVLGSFVWLAASCVAARSILNENFLWYGIGMLGLFILFWIGETYRAIRAYNKLKGSKGRDEA